VLADGGGWPPFPPGPALAPGDLESRVLVLRERLATSEDLPYRRPAADPERFDPDLETAVRRFQARHGLAGDGIVGTPPPLPR